MTPVQWIVLFAAIAAVVAVYWFARRHREEDVWKPRPGDRVEHGPDYASVGLADDPYEVKPRPDGEEAAQAPLHPVIVDPQVQDEYAPPTAIKAAEPAVDVSGAKSWDNFAIKPDPQLGLNIEPGADPRGRVAAPPGEEKIVSLHVAARDGGRFAGPSVHTALQICRLQFGMHEIYHRITEVNGVPEAVFSVANMVKPGHLDPATAEFSTPGLTLFMLMPGPVEGVAAFRDMLDTAHRLAQRLNGDLLDDKRAVLTHQSEQYLFDEIANTERRWRAQPRRK